MSFHALTSSKIILLGPRMKFKTKIWQLSILVHITSRKLAPNHMSIDRSKTKKLLNEHVNMRKCF